MRFCIFLVIITSTFFVSVAQEKPTDFLSKEFHKGRRDAVRKLMPANSVAVFFTNPVRNRANDVDYVYHQDPDFYYLTGYQEPNAVLLIFSENRTDSDNETYNEIIFVREKNAREEMWNGKRLGISGVKNKLGFKQVFSTADFFNFEINFDVFEYVMVYDFKNDYRDSRSNKEDLFNLVKFFKTKVNYPADYDPVKQQIYTRIMATEIENSANVAQSLGRVLNFYEDLKSDELISGFINAKDDAIRKELKEKMILKVTENKLNSSLLEEIMNTLRETKTKEELVLLKKAVEISAVGQLEVMKAMKPDISETEIQGIHEFVYKKYGAEYEGYPSIVGAGNNGCILHYIENNKPKVGERELVLMDLGAEYHGYTADVTRTIPVSGKFTREQKLIYDLVYEAQEAGIKAAVVGAPYSASEKAARKVINKGLITLGIVKEEEEARMYFPHGTSHYLGLDVHDKGTYGNFKENTVITVEPGIYIPEGSNCDKKWWTIGVRIEDDILITKNGPINLSEMAPRKSEDVEAAMKQKSVLDDFKLPVLD
ncbi:xaa-pro aminopeptidase [Aquimarina aggregata]|uniref:Xaa-Pro aminopeptidase n=1 Tax=Aquimarina aggregata TaxID=1642818 RepID=A0A163BP97_9FLAO|nr:aminopeptidase P family protein [Aquimarina aggregata]KZS41611.1 xaa-pro aminopeptidase [Aquimarina aggregata]